MYTVQVEEYENNLKGEIRRSDGSGPMFAGDNCELKPIPSAESPSLRFVEAGTPIRILRSWQGPDGNYWLHVQILSFQVSEIVGQATRGWVNV